MASDRPMVRQPARAQPRSAHDHRRDVLALQAQLPSASKQASQRAPQSPSHQASAGGDRVHLCRVNARWWAATYPRDMCHPTASANTAMTKRTREVMFRIGSEEDLPDPPTAAPACAQSPSRAAAPNASEPSPAPAIQAQPTRPAASAAEVLDAPVAVSPVRPAQAMKPSPSAMPATSASRAPVPTPLRRREPRAHQNHHHAGRRDRSIASPRRRQRPGLVPLHIWIASLNALIVTMLVVAAVIGHAPPATSAVGQESPTTTRQAAARPVASSVNTRSATSRAIASPLTGRHHPQARRRSRTRLTAQAHRASEAPIMRPAHAPIPQRTASPPTATAHRVASSPPPAPAPTSATPPSSRHRRADENSQNAAAVEFGP
jgi:hypothetical protein